MTREVILGGVGGEGGGGGRVAVDSVLFSPNCGLY